MMLLVGICLFAAYLILVCGNWLCTCAVCAEVVANVL
jgi:hypothetical protein